MADRSQRVYRLRIALILSCAILGIILLIIGYQAVQTLMQLDAIERERDQWQRPAEVLQSLNAHARSIVVDLGCGSGYFALKLSPIVGVRGRVLAIDIRRLSLCFLWIRTVLRHEHNISVVHAQPDNPGLPTGAVDAVLISNTYHELTQPKIILQRVFDSLRLHGRLVVLDRGPDSTHDAIRGVETHHDLPSDVAEQEIRQAGFEIISQQDHFIDGPGREPWWLIIAQKP